MSSVTGGEAPLPNVLFALYSDFTCNAAAHVYSLANELTALGCSCAVAVPHNRETIQIFGSPAFQTALFEELELGTFQFSNGRGPDIVHAWTPREVVRKFCINISRRYSFRLFVHLEDNEWLLLSRFTGRSTADIGDLAPSQWEGGVPDSLSHPMKSQRFLETADGCTVIIDRLREFIPPGIPVQVIWPAAQQDFFSHRPLPKVDGGVLGISACDVVIVYPGNVHLANRDEVREVYSAVATLNRQGCPATLVRTGVNYCDFLGPEELACADHYIELGFLSRQETASVLTLADIFVQPGRSDAFNDYRFPSKIPEFLSIGRPVILPASNIALEMTHRRHAYILQDANGANIARAVREIMSEDGLYNRLSAGATEFYQTHLNWMWSARSLLEFYSRSATTGLVNSA